MVTPLALLSALALFHLSRAADPANVASYHGSDVTINCSDDDAVNSKIWKKGGMTIVSGNGQPANRTKYSITKNDGSYNLGINNVQATDAGEYVCGGSTDKGAYLIVAENLQCEVTSAVSGQVNAKCNFRYGGEWTPTCEIKKNGELLRGGSPKTANNQYSRKVSGVAVTSGDEISCSLSMTSTGRPDNVPTNDPAFTPPSNAAKTLTLTPPILYRGLHFSKTDFMEGDLLNCLSATCYPMPTYNWTMDSSGKVFANRMTIEMTSAMSGLVLRCEAYNSLGRQSMTFNVTSVTATTTADAPTAASMDPDYDFAQAYRGNPALLAVVCLVIRLLSRP